MFIQSGLWPAARLEHGHKGYVTGKIEVCLQLQISAQVRVFQRN